MALQEDMDHLRVQSKKYDLLVERHKATETVLKQRISMLRNNLKEAEAMGLEINTELPVSTAGVLRDLNTVELGYDRLNGTRKIGPSYAKSVVYIWRILDMHRTGTKHIVRHMQKICRTVVRHIQVHLYR